MKKKNIILLSLLYIVYFTGLLTKKWQLGDILSPILTFISFYYTFHFLYIKQINKSNKLSAVFMGLSILSWFICDLMWGISSLILRTNPEDNMIITYGYSLTNLFLLISVAFFGYKEIKNWNKMQFLLDSTIISICIMTFMWLFVFEQNIENAMLLRNDIVSMLSLLSDIVIFAWLSIWFFSVRKSKIQTFMKFTSSGILLFVIVDFIYYYAYFYHLYEPNTILDGFYVIAFTFMGIGGIVRGKSKEVIDKEIMAYKEIKRVGKEIILLAVPILLVIFKRDYTQYLLLVVSSIMIYYVFTNYTQKSIFRDELLEREKEYIEELEAQVEERTGQVVTLMNTDTITGLYNRRFFEEYLLNICKNIKKREKILLFYIEMNKYKMIKAMYGKYISEKLLYELGNRIKTIAVEREEGVLASYGDEIFILSLVGNDTYEQGLQTAERIMHLCSDIYHIENSDIVVTLNIGISCYPFDSKSSEELIKNADNAMMQARTIGFNKSLVFNDQIGKNIYNRSIIEIWLKKVKIDEEFKLYYQPQVRCEDGSLIGFEALARWQTKGGKFIPPSEFIPIAEETGIINPLGYWIMEQAVNQLVEWNKISEKDLRMAINVSAKQFTDKEFVPKFNAILEKYSVDPQTIEIEITENIQLQENIEMSEILHEISDMGVSIAVDDFGTGYSSLYYLKNIPVNRIKIAKELIDNIEQDLYDYAIAKAVISIGKTRQIKVIAEGVENKGQWECLKELECDEIQGYYFAKPMPAEEILNFWI